MENVDFTQYLTAERVLLLEEVSSKKRALELLSEVLANDMPQTDANTILDGLIARERLGSTALGEGVAIPHCRTQSIDKIHCAILKLEHGIDFEALDGLDVTLLFTLVVPEEETEEHLLLLGKLAEFLSKPSNREKIRNCQNVEDVLVTLGSGSTSHAA